MKVLVRKADQVALYAGAEIIAGKNVITVGKEFERYRVFNIDPKSVEIVDVPDADMPADFAPELYAWTGAALTATDRKVEQDAEKEADGRAETAARDRAALEAQAPGVLMMVVSAIENSEPLPQAVSNWADAYATARLGQIDGEPKGGDPGGEEEGKGQEVLMPREIE